MKKYDIKISEEHANTLQKYGFEVDAKTSIIDRIFTNHKDDLDNSVFESIPFKTYMKEYETVLASYNFAKDELTEYLKPLVYEKEGKEVSFDWNIDDFLSAEVHITVYEG